MLGWFSLDSARASLRKYLRAESSEKVWGGKYFDGYVAVEVLVVRAIYFAHAAGADLLDNPVVA